jgi:hypothetical protein
MDACQAGMGMQEPTDLGDEGPPPGDGSGKDVLAQEAADPGHDAHPGHLIQEPFRLSRVKRRQAPLGRSGCQVGVDVRDVMAIKPSG